MQDLPRLRILRKEGLGDSTWQRDVCWRQNIKKNQKSPTTTSWAVIKMKTVTSICVSQSVMFYTYILYYKIQNIFNFLIYSPTPAILYLVYVGGEICYFDYEFSTSRQTYNRSRKEMEFSWRPNLKAGCTECMMGDLRLVPLKTWDVIPDGWVNTTLCLVEMLVFWKKRWDEECIMVLESQRGKLEWKLVILCCLAAKLFLLWKSSKIDGGQIPFLLPKPKGADISLFSLPGSQGTWKGSANWTLPPGMLSHEKVTQGAETVGNKQDGGECLSRPAWASLPECHLRCDLEYTSRCIIVLGYIFSSCFFIFLCYIFLVKFPSCLIN